MIRLLVLLTLLAVGQKAGRRMPTLDELRDGPPTVDVATSCAL